MPQDPTPQIFEVHYVDADTGAILETVKMRQFVGWNNWDPHRRPRREVIRQYALDREHIVNPSFNPG